MNPSNIAIHQSRHQDPLAKATNSLRPGDGKRYAVSSLIKLESGHSGLGFYTS
jgi:hypothetical protein